MKIDLEGIHPKKLLRRFVSLFLGLFILNICPTLVNLDLYQIFVVAIIYITLYSVIEFVYLIWIIHYFKSHKMGKNKLYLLKILHYLISWFLLFAISFILKEKYSMSFIATILLSIIMEILYVLLIYKKEDVPCQKNLY